MYVDFIYFLKIEGEVWENVLGVVPQGGDRYLHIPSRIGTDICEKFRGNIYI